MLFGKTFVMENILPNPTPIFHWNSGFSSQFSKLNITTLKAMCCSVLAFGIYKECFAIHEMLYQIDPRSAAFAILQR